MHSKNSLWVMIVILALATLMLGGCSMAGKALEGTGSVFNKTGNAIGNL
jgi:hypothetical protein